MVAGQIPTGWEAGLYGIPDEIIVRKEIASDTILSGKAKVMIAGGFDDISEESSYEFANMN